jgi:hypothetical protein
LIYLVLKILNRIVLNRYKRLSYLVLIGKNSFSYV